MVPFSFAGHDFSASLDGALYWPARRAMLVADLHLEKASWFARMGQMLPPYDSLATLQALERQVDACGATTLYCLGDSFHDRFGCDRLPDDARALRADHLGHVGRGRHGQSGAGQLCRVKSRPDWHV
jgi:metallophosphoesterase superfamily enzyme